MVDSGEVKQGFHKVDECRIHLYLDRNRYTSLVPSRPRQVHCLPQVIELPTSPPEPPNNYLLCNNFIVKLAPLPYLVSIMPRICIYASGKRIATFLIHQVGNE